MYKKETRLMAQTLLFVLIFATACKEEQVVGPGTQDAIVGYFLTEDGTPISSAIVELTDAEGNLLFEGITENDGSFTIESIPQETENSIIAFSKDGKILQLTRLETLIERAKSNSNKRGDIFLDEEYDYNTTCLVKVIDKITRDPIANALVQLGTSENAVKEFHTNSEGIAILKFISSSHYRIFKISKDDYLIYTGYGFRMFYPNDITDDPFELEPKETSDNTANNTIIVTLQPPYIGLLPLVYRKVNIMGENDYKDSAITAGDINDFFNMGSAKFTGLKSGLYIVSFEAEAGDYERIEQEIQVSGNETKEVRLFTYRKQNLCTNNVLIINFTDENGNVINSGEATIFAYNFGMVGEGTDALARKTVSISNGKAVFNGFTKGENTYYIEKVDSEYKIHKGKDLTKNVRFDCGETVVRDVALMVEKEFDTNCCDNNFGIRVYDMTNYPGGGEPPPFSNQKVKIIGANGFTQTVISAIDPNGNPYNTIAKFENICFGTYKIFLDSDTHTSDTLEVKVRCNNDITFIGEGGKNYLYCYPK